MTQAFDAIILGAGYYGSRIALHLRQSGMDRVAIVEREQDILARASTWNQARVHGGYHYPRARLTALACRRSYRRFLKDHGDAVVTGMRACYAIARDSNVSPSQFESLCESIGAPLRTASPQDSAVFDADLIAAVYVVEEIAFDVSSIRDALAAALRKAGVVTMTGIEARYLGTKAGLARIEAGRETLVAPYVFNCTYSGLGHCGIPVRAGLLYEWAEMALVDVPPELSGYGLTVMDGPFFSVMPFASQGTHTLSHVRYTPVVAWNSGEAPPRPDLFAGLGQPWNGPAMLRDAARYIPRLKSSRIRGSVFEIKSTLSRNARDDGRPILMEVSMDNPNVISILGSKLDNIYDVLDEIDAIMSA